MEAQKWFDVRWRAGWHGHWTDWVEMAVPENDDERLGIWTLLQGLEEDRLFAPENLPQSITVYRADGTQSQYRIFDREVAGEQAL
jgi:hypothetical protein